MLRSPARVVAEDRCDRIADNALRVLSSSDAYPRPQKDLLIKPIRNARLAWRLPLRRATGYRRAHLRLLKSLLGQVFFDWSINSSAAKTRKIPWGP
jgi:hypothetical protein